VANRDVLAIGASAGGFEALRFLAAGLPQDLPASVLMVIHLPSQFPSELDSILTNSGHLPARFARDGEKLEHSRIYLAPAGSHLLVDGNVLHLGHGPQENNTRPAIDPLLRSAALCCAPRAIGVILTGTLGDGASGLWALKQAGGVTVVHDPADAAYPEMPSSALRRVKPDHVVSLRAMPALLNELVREPAGPPRPVPAEMKYEVMVARGDPGSMQEMDRIGRRSVLTCPECNGTMWEINEGDLVRYRCHIGHAYTAEVMSLALDENLRRALASGLRAIEERIALVRRLEKQASEAGREQLAERWERKAQEFEDEQMLLRDTIRRIDKIAARAPQT